MEDYRLPVRRDDPLPVGSWIDQSVSWGMARHFTVRSSAALYTVMYKTTVFAAVAVCNTDDIFNYTHGYSRVTNIYAVAGASLQEHG